MNIVTKSIIYLTNYQLKTKQQLSHISYLNQPLLLCFSLVLRVLNLMS